MGEMYQKQPCMQALLCLYQQRNTLVNMLPEGEFHFNSTNFIYKNIFIVDAKVKELVYSGNTVFFLLPIRECMRENKFFLVTFTINDPLFHQF